MKTLFSVSEGELFPLEDGYLVIGDVTREFAVQKIIDFEIAECNLDSDECVQNEDLVKRYIKSFDFPNIGMSDLTFSFHDKDASYVGLGIPCWAVFF